jgi:putative membrane protein
MFNYIPTLFFSIPEPSTAINVLPGHKMVLEGKGLNALYISLMSCLLTLVAIVVTLPFFTWIVPLIHSALDGYIHFLIISMAIWVILKEEGIKKFYSALLFMLSGVWGVITLNSILINSNDVLFPALTGMFGLASMLISAQSTDVLPKQKVEKNIKTGNLAKTVLSGIFAGLLIGILPGIGESQAGVLVSQFTNISNKEFLGSLASINMSNLLFSIVSFYSLGRIRSGVGAAISEILTNYNFSMFIMSLGVILFSGALSSLLTWFVGKKTLIILQKINYKLVTSFIIAFIVFTVFWITGFIGLLVMIVSTALGFLALFWGVNRTVNMGYLMLSTLIYFTGLTHVVNMLLF